MLALVSIFLGRPFGVCVFVIRLCVQSGVAQRLSDGEDGSLIAAHMNVYNHNRYPNSRTLPLLLMQHLPIQLD